LHYRQQLRFVLLFPKMLAESPARSSKVLSIMLALILSVIARMRLEGKDHASRNHNIVLPASLYWSAECGIADRIVIAHFAAQADGEQYFNWRADINPGAKLSCACALVPRWVALPLDEKFATLRDSIAKSAGNPGRDASIRPELHPKRGHNEDCCQRDDGLRIGRSYAVAGFAYKGKFDRE